LEKSGLFDETLRSVEDRDLWLRISAHCKIACLPTVFCRRRLHGSNISREQEHSITGRIKTLEKNRRSFPHLAPRALWHRELGNAYCRLSYFHLQKNERAKALPAGLKSLAHGVGAMLAGGSPVSYNWALGIGSILTALLGWKASRSLWRATLGDRREA
jgi:hypothetical protein